MSNETKEAVSKLCAELRNDPEYFYSWQANIAMAFKDEFDRRMLQPTMPQDIHSIANDAARSFLSQLINH